MSNSPSVSIIMPTLNASATLSRAVESVRRQSFRDWELLLLDGGSTDNTVGIANGFNDGRIRTFAEKDNGIYDGMNKGIKLAQGVWLYFLGADDYLLNDSVLETMIDNTDDADVIYGDVEADSLGVEWQGPWSLETIDYNRCHQAIFYRKEVFSKVGLYPVKYRLAADHYINICCLLDKRIRLQYKPVKVAHFSDGGFSYHYHDKDFDMDRDWFVLRHGYKVLHYKQTLRHCRAALACNPPLFRRLRIYLIAAMVLLLKPNKK